KNSDDERDVSVTYWMNELQTIRKDCPLFVTLNPVNKPDQSLTLNRFNYSHPLFNASAIEAQQRMHEIQGKDRIWFCGAWTAFGFHEDGLNSGLNVAEALGGVVPWRQKDQFDMVVHANNQVQQPAVAAE
ncbi:MAG: NAD/FAD-binding protein, partial [Pseudomonadota bacterium]